MEVVVQNDLWVLFALASSVLLPFILSLYKAKNSVIRNPFSGWSPLWLVRWRSLFNGRKHLAEANAKAVETGKPCLLPGFFGDTVVLPPSLIGWLAKQPSSLFSSTSAQNTFFSIPTTIALCNKVIGETPVLERVVRRGLNARLEVLPAEVMEEIDAAFTELWGTDTQSPREIDLDHTIVRIVARAASRMLMGPDFCRNKDYIENCISYVNDIIMSAMALNAFPKLLRPLLSPLLIIPNRIHCNRALAYLKPYFAKAIETFSTDPSSMPEIYATWQIKHVMKEMNDERERTPDVMSRRVMVFNFAAVHTSNLSANSFLLDILSDPNKDEILKNLRAETRDSADAFHSEWNRTRLLKLHKLDSALRESMRVSSFLQRGLLREVVAPEGALLPDGTHVKKNTLVCFSADAVHHDPTTYPDPFTYKFDRFLATNQNSTNGPAVVDLPESETSSIESKATSSDQKHLIKTAVESDASHLVWGLGKSACPGRYFAVDIVKMIISYAISKYDIELVGDRPNLGWLEFHEIPPMGAKLKIRRREISDWD